MGAVRKNDLQRVIVDTTVQEKAIAHPSDSRLLEVARAKIVRLAQRAGIRLKLTHEREAATLRRRAGGYAHARQFKRLKRVLRRQRTILGIVLREVQRKMADLPQAAQQALNHWMGLAERIRTQRPKDSGKLYALHAPEAECISKGKSRQPYEFGVKASIAVTHRQGLIVGARAFPGNPYDGHTLAEQIEQTTNLLQDLNVKPTTAIVDLGYRGVDHLVPVDIVHRGRFKTMAAKQRRWLRRRQAVEPVIGHLKSDHGVSGIPIIPTCGKRILPTHHCQGGNDGSGSSRSTDAGCVRPGPEGPGRRGGYRSRTEPGCGGRLDQPTCLASSS